jgi:threonine synthase
MNYYSTRNPALRTTFRNAVLQGLAPDGGLYFPEVIPSLPKGFFRTISQKSFSDLSFEVAHTFLGDDLPKDALRLIVDRTTGADTPLVGIEPGVFALELFHGPTLAFKDFGARFLSGLLSHFAREGNDEITILVATSGDTGSAVAHGFLNAPGIRVVILYPSGKVSEIQEKQLTTLGANITALEIDGTFDDCQRLVKQAFQDKELNLKRRMTSANSINIGRLIPQLFYYFRAIAQLPNDHDPVVFSVPSGNFGNLTAGLLAQRMGLPVRAFIAATNANNIVPEYLRTGVFSPRPSQTTISNAMDVGAPSNFSRLLALYANDGEKLARAMSGYFFSDEETRAAMARVFAQDGYLLDPHGAVGYLGLQEYLRHRSGLTGIFLETAHPGKFQSVVEEALKTTFALPEKLATVLRQKKQSLFLKARFEDLRDYLLKP